jgi:hypothetical protein
MESTNEQFETAITVEEDILFINATGTYSLTNAKNLFKLSIDNALLYTKRKILIDITAITGSIPFLDRFEFSEFLSQYKAKYSLKKIGKIAVAGQEPIVDKGRFGENVAVNRGANVRVFTDIKEALIWLKEE